MRVIPLATGIAECSSETSCLLERRRWPLVLLGEEALASGQDVGVQKPLGEEARVRRPESRGRLYERERERER